MFPRTPGALAGAAIAAAIASGCPMVSAHADTIHDMGTLGPVPYINTATVAAGPVFTLALTGTTPYNFTDTYNFTVAGSPTVAGTAVTVNLDLGSFGFHISNLKLDLFDADNLWLDGDILSGPSDASVSVDGSLVAGNYYFKVRGFADGEGTGQGIYTFTAAAVPEAGASVMMLAGLGLTGFVASRRGRRDRT